MNMPQSLLIEIGTEELPPKTLDELANIFCASVAEGLKKRGIDFDEASAHPLYSPRRLAVRIDEVASQQAEQKLERRGPAVNAAFDASGQPSKALTGFATANGVSVADLQKLETDKGAWFVFRQTKAGESTTKLLPIIIDEALKALPIPKPMRWSNKDFLFVRPPHWLIILLGDQVVDGSVLGLNSDRLSQGHRFHHPQPVWIGTPETYIEALRAAHVLVDPEERLTRIRSEVERVTAHVGGKARLRPELLNEVKNLVEWPVAIACTFDPIFLKVPQEALITTMESNQKFFPVFDPHGMLTEHFIGIANIESKNPAEIRKGYERVIRPRFADAKFFFDEDLKLPLETHQAALEKVTYQASLGSIWQKVERVSLLAQTVANRMKDAGVAIEIPLVGIAAHLSKCDLMTRMVGEFPELQGIMGRTYAKLQGQPTEVAQALDEFYRPRFAGDAIAQGTVAQALSIAEKLDTLAGLFAVGQKPTGSKDPFSLRRNALGLARTLIEGKLDLDMVVLIEDALAFTLSAKKRTWKESDRKSKTDPRLSLAIWEAMGEPPSRQELAQELYDFILDRLLGYYSDQGIGSEVFDAVAALKPANLFDFDRRLRAVIAFSNLPEAASLAAANKRIGNILKQAVEKSIKLGNNIEITTALEAGAETELKSAIEAAYADSKPLADNRDYVAVLSRLAQLQAPVNAFFDNVMVMVDDPVKRQNRLNMLNELHNMFMRVADVARLPSN